MYTYSHSLLGYELFPCLRQVGFIPSRKIAQVGRPERICRKRQILVEQTKRSYVL